MPANSEATVNVQLGDLLRTKHPAWRDGIGVEQSQVLRNAARRPDIMVSHPGGQVIVLETEFAPGATVERDACARLGQVVDSPGEVVEQAIAVLLPRDLRTGQGELASRVAEARLRYAVLAGEPEAPVRWPEAGWLEGDANDLAACIEHAALSERQVEEGTEILETAVRWAAFRLEELVRWQQKNTLDRISAVLHQEKSEQTTRMAMAIVANALTFHATIAGSHDIPALDDLCFQDGTLDKKQLLLCWRRILREINYRPIFKIATDLLGPFPIYLACQVLNLLEPAARSLAKIGAAGTHDLSGQMFQRLIVDRKFLATFYTLPASAVLLSELAVPRLDVQWGSQEEVCGLRIADLACGTGTLLNAAYQSIRAHHRRAGGDDQHIHAGMMEQALVAADIMPAATHLTASILSGAHPTVPFVGTRIVTMPYGEQPPETGRPLSIGSLDLLGEESARSLMGTGPSLQIDAFGTSRKQVRGTGEPEEAADPHVVDLSDESGDLIIMNPPFTRPTNHESTTIPVPSFAGFETSQAEQKAMSGKLARLRKGLDAPAGAGNAGLASYFVDLAHVKTKPGGVMALVLPAAFVQGGSWKAARGLLDRRYEDVLVVSIAASGKTDRAFSADTGMAEVLVVGTRKRSADSESGPQDALFVNLLRRPRTLGEAAALRAWCGGSTRGAAAGGCSWATPPTQAASFARRWRRAGARRCGNRLWRRPCCRFGRARSRFLERMPVLRCRWRPWTGSDGAGCFTGTSRASIPAVRQGVRSTFWLRAIGRSIRSCGRTTLSANEAWWWLPTEKASSERARKCRPWRCGRTRPPSSTSTWTFSSTPRAWPPA